MRRSHGYLPERPGKALDLGRLVVVHETDPAMPSDSASPGARISS
jgi:hypothetical protein